MFIEVNNIIGDSINPFFLVDIMEYFFIIRDSDCCEVEQSTCKDHSKENDRCAFGDKFVSNNQWERDKADV